MEDWRLVGNFKDITDNKFKKTKFKSTEKMIMNIVSFVE